MELTVPAGLPRSLPPLAARRLERLGFGGTATRAQVVAVCRSRRAGDQFIHTWTRRGLLVPSRWGSYHIATERAASVALAARSPVHGRLLAWAQTPHRALGLPRRPAFMGPVLWQHTDLSVDSPGLLLPLLAGDRRVPATAPQLEAFAVDLAWPPERLEIRVGAIATVRTLSPRLADASWVLSLNLDARIRAAGRALARKLEGADRKRTTEVLRLANFAALSPTGRRSLRPMVGPPGQYRVFAPRWYMEPHLDALQGEARRGRRG